MKLLPRFRPPPTRMLVGAGDGAHLPKLPMGDPHARRTVPAWVGTHSNEVGPIRPTAFGPAFPNVLKALSKMMPAPRAWWIDAKGRLFEIAEFAGEDEAVTMALALPVLEHALRMAPPRRGESLASVAERIGCPREDLTLLALDKVQGLVRMGSTGTQLPPVNGVPQGTPPRPGMIFGIARGDYGGPETSHMVSVAGNRLGVFPARQIAHGLRKGDPLARRFVAGARAAAAQGSRAHAEALLTVQKAARLQARKEFTAHYRAMGQAIANVKAKTRGTAAGWSLLYELGDLS